MKCQRCNASFECKMDDIANCQCSTVRVSEATHVFLKQTNYGCLCKKCLAQINELVEKTKLHSFPTQPSQLVEGLHYYIEDGLFVFTEFYHMLRGHCCENDCRHCAFQ
ncbi:MAG TPA: hypothetical protein ENJ53_09335 [Phaeodactylibacter sp.]|nr:hypothetical protein [Phaeodactylibacter sp.]